MTRNNNTKFLRLGDLIETVSEKCGSNGAIVSGVDINKQFISTRANLEETDTSKYSLVRPTWFACNLMHIGRDERIPVAFNDSDDNLIVTSAYYVFRVKEEMKDRILNEFLYIFFSSQEVDRLCWFYTDSSVRGNLKESRFSDIMIPVPLMERQREIVDTWQSLRKVKEENEALATPLFQLCQSKIQDLKHSLEPVEIGQYIEQSDDRNSNGMYTAEDVRGVSIEKRIINTKANMKGVPVTSYKLFRPSEFCYVPVTSRNGDKITLALNQTASTFIVSGTYEVFRIKNDTAVLPDYLFMWFCRPEFDRLARFHSWGSARESFAFADMERVRVPIPEIEVQQAIVDIFNCARKAKQIAEEADKLSRDICPALIQKIINS